MKRVVYITLLAIATLSVSAQTQKDKERFSYVASQLKLTKEEKSKLQPVFYAYRKELHSAKDIYNSLKDKHITAIRKKTLTPEQAKALNNAHWLSDAKVTEIRKAYTQKFSTVLSPQQVYYLFTYANDSKEKRARK